MNRQSMISELQKRGFNYKFDKYTDAQLFWIYTRTMNSIKNSIVRDDKIRKHNLCPECGSYLSDAGYCPVCDDNDDALLNENLIRKFYKGFILQYNNSSLNDFFKNKYSSSFDLNIEIINGRESEGTFNSFTEAKRFVDEHNIFIRVPVYVIEDIVGGPKVVTCEEALKFLEESTFNKKEHEGVKVQSIEYHTLDNYSYDYFTLGEYISLEHALENFKSREDDIKDLIRQYPLREDELSHSNCYAVRVIRDDDIIDADDDIETEEHTEEVEEDDVWVIYIPEGPYGEPCYYNERYLKVYLGSIELEEGEADIVFTNDINEATKFYNKKEAEKYAYDEDTFYQIWGDDETPQDCLKVIKESEANN